MIVKGKEKKSFPFSPIWLLVIVISGIIAYSLLSKKRIDYSLNAETILCDAETVVDGLYKTDGATFKNGNTQSNLKSYRGSKSARLDPQQQYGMSYSKQSPATYMRYKASIRRYSNNPFGSALAITTEPAWNGYAQSNIATEKDENGWELLEVELVIPDTATINKISIFPYFTDKSGEAYFDDLKITVNELPRANDLDLAKLHIYLDDKALNKINTKRVEALKKGLLQTEDDDWVKAKLTENDSLSYEVKLRLKGDWTDHLRGDYWSYRIKMPKDKSWNRLQTFSLQDPKTRSYLDEWIYHKALEKVDVITPRYGFVEFQQNNLLPVLYVYEEHFEKQIAEYKNRREGVILKLSDEYLWNQRVVNKGEATPDVFENTISNSDILPFGEKKTFSNPKLKEQFIRAQDLLNAFKERKSTADEIFDMKLLANYFAITDIFNANHGAIWHNLRFYYNAITRKLEPIGFDGFTENGFFQMYVKLFFGEFQSSDGIDEWTSFYRYIYRNPEFNKYYVPALNRFSSSDFVNEVLQENQQEAENLESLIQLYCDIKYKYDIKKIKLRANNIHRNIQPVDEISIKAYRSSKTSNVVSLSNYHPVPLTIVGSGVTDDEKHATPTHALIRSNGRNRPVMYTKVEIPTNHKYIFYKLGDDGEKTYKSRIRPWRSPEDLIVQYSTKSKIQIPLDKAHYDIIDENIYIKSGNHIITKPMIIPYGYRLIIEEGTSIDLQNKSYILVYGGVKMIGNEEDPISITSTDKSAQGFVVIGDNDTSIIQYASFSQLNTLEENEWQLTGAVTFYESNVELYNVTITDNTCEDALNIIRSEFNISKLNINNTFADGFDSDFCKGKITDSYFFNTGNDAVDYSGSVVDIQNLILKNIGDKGISAGEQTTIKVKNVEIDGAVIAVASKDLSLVTISDMRISNCNQGFVAYRKKPEFGGGNINVNSYTATNVDKLVQSDEESKISLPQ